jgi:hypothetical protein
MKTTRVPLAILGLLVGITVLAPGRTPPCRRPEEPGFSG